MTTWMIVEDEPDLHEILTLMIERIGHDVLGFTDGEAALDWLNRLDSNSTHKPLPELALIDIRLPGTVNGPDVAAKLRQHPATRQMAIVLMTAYRLSVKEEAEIRRFATPDMMLYKPLPDFAVFRRKLEDLLM